MNINEMREIMESKNSQVEKEYQSGDSDLSKPYLRGYLAACEYILGYIGSEPFKESDFIEKKTKIKKTKRTKKGNLYGKSVRKVVRKAIKIHEDKPLKRIGRPRKLKTAGDAALNG